MDVTQAPPGNWPDMIDAMATLGTFGAGAAVSVDQLLQGRPDLARKVGRLDPVVAAATFGALLTVPELQANAVRIEAMAHLALASGGGGLGGPKPTDKLLCNLFGFLGEGVCGSMEDPSEDVMVGAVRSPWGNFRVLEGLWEGGSFYLQRFLDVLEHMPNGAGYNALRRFTVALLRVSEAVCQRARLSRFQLGAELPADTLPQRRLAALLLRRRHLRFTADDLAAIGVAPADLRPFVFDPASREALKREPLGASTLERFPVLRSRNAYYLVLPTAVSSAIRCFLVAELGRAGMTDAFAKALALTYADLFAETPLLGGRTCRGLRFAPGPNGAFAEAMTEFDDGRFLHFLFFTDPLTDLEESGLAGLNPASLAIGPEIDRRISVVRRSAAETRGFRSGLTLLVGCGIGRGVAVAFGEEDWPDWRVESCSAYDLITLSWTTNFNPSALWRMLDARDRVHALGTNLLNINGLINLVAWARSLDGHLVPHAQLPDASPDPARSIMLLVDQNRQRELRHASALAFDPRVEQFIDGRWIRLRKDHQSIFADDRAAPLYASEDIGESGGLLSAFLARGRIWWADVITPDEADRGLAYESWRTVSVWLARAAPVLDELEGLGAGPVLWRVVFEAVAVEGPLPSTMLDYEAARAAMHVEVDPTRRTIVTYVGGAYDRALFHPDNIAERALVAALTQGAAMLAGQDDPAIVEAALLPRIVTNPQARYRHAVSMRGFRDQVRADLTGRPLFIGAEDDAFTRLGLGWSVREPALGPRISGKADCSAYLHALVRHVEDDIIADLRGFDRRAMLEAVLYNHERGAIDRELWRRTSAAMIGLHGNTSETMGQITEREFKLNAVFQTARILSEMALCECPIEGGAKPGTLDLSLLMAKAALVFELGGWSGAIHWDMMKPELRITPLGDVHANFDWHEQVVQPHAHVTSQGRIDQAVSSYAQNLEEPSVQVTVGHLVPPAFAAAWEEQFGATIDQTRILIDWIEQLAVDAGKAVISVPRSAFKNITAAGQALPDAVADVLADQLTLATQESWRVVPAGFDEADRQPWRFRRRLSVLRRPLLRIDDAVDSTLLVAPGMVRDAFGYMLNAYYRGDLPVHQLSPLMRKWKTAVESERGAKFEREVADALQDMGWETRVGTTVPALLGHGLDRNLGDIDVLAWSRDTGRVMVIECKDVQYRKTYTEIAEQLADFRGEVRSNGKADYLLKHLRRVEAISAEPDAVARSTGLSDVAIESHLLFRHPVPMEFALSRIADKVRVSHFDRISEL